MLMTWRKHALLGVCTAVVSKEFELLSNICFLKRPIYLVPVWKQEYPMTVVVAKPKMMKQRHGQLSQIT
jgi:hypothetical protein